MNNSLWHLKMIRNSDFHCPQMTFCWISAMLFCYDSSIEQLLQKSHSSQSPNIYRVVLGGLCEKTKFFLYPSFRSKIKDLPALPAHRASQQLAQRSKASVKGPAKGQSISWGFEISSSMWCGEEPFPFWVFVPHKCKPHGL